MRTPRLMRGVEDGIEKHGYRGNRERDDYWPDQATKR